MTTPDDLTCQELVELVTDYLEGALSSADLERFERHLTECDGCRRYLEQFRTVIRLAGRLTVAALPADAQDRLLAAFRGWHRGDRFPG